MSDQPMQEPTAEPTVTPPAKAATPKKAVRVRKVKADGASMQDAAATVHWQAVGSGYRLVVRADAREDAVAAVCEYTGLKEPAFVFSKLLDAPTGGTPVIRVWRAPAIEVVDGKEVSVSKLHYERS